MTKFKAPSKIYFYDILTDEIIEYLYSYRATWYHYSDGHGDGVSVSESQIFSKDNFPDDDHLGGGLECFFTRKEACVKFRQIYLSFCLSEVQIRIMKLSEDARIYSDRLNEERI